MEDFTALAGTLSGSVGDARGALILSKDGLVLGADPADAESLLKPAWLHFASLGEPERGFVQFGTEIWCYVRRGPYAAFVVSGVGVRPGLVIDEMEMVLLAAEQARAKREVLRAEPSPPAPAAEPGGSARPSRRARILVVEDNRDVRESFVEYLSAHLGHEVAFAEDGESGVAKALQWQPELVFCDIGLPRLDGYGFARALRAAPSLREAVLVAMTGYGSEGDKVLASESGFDQHFTKPVDLDTLERFIDGLPRGKRGSPGASGTSPPPRADPRE